MIRDIPFFNYPALYAKQEDDLLPIIQNVLRRGAYIMQSDLDTFETSLARYLNVKHVIGVADGTMALIIGLRASGIGAGDEVLVPSHTFVATAAAVHHAGATPVLVDCARDHLIDSADIERRINDRTRAIMPVQLNGRTADMDKIVNIADRYNLKIIEDSAQALGSKFRNRFAGTFGSAGTCSFYPSKTLGCFGDGGAVITNDDDVADHVKLLRDHGRSMNGEVIEWGYNSRLDNLQAAILNYKLSNYIVEIERRREIARIYNSKLGAISNILLPPGPDDSEDHFDIFQNYEIEVDRRDELRNFLLSKGVRTIVQWGGRCIHQFSALGLNTDVPYTESMTKRFMLLPMNTSLEDEDVHYIC